jgi:hypothetical protein
MNYITLADIRAVTSIDTDLISDADLTVIANEAEKKIESMLKTVFTPKTVIRQYEGTGTNCLSLVFNPILKIHSLKIDETSISPKYLRLDKGSGIVWLTNESEVQTFEAVSTERNLVRIKFDYGWLEETDTTTNLSEAIEEGTNVELSVSDATDFSENDFIEIQGLDSMQETCKITDVTGDVITVDKLSIPHEADSLITKVQCPEIVKRLMILSAGINASARVIASTYTVNVSYAIEGINVSKGVPYTHWKALNAELSKEYSELLLNVRPRIAIA